jgi:hypothetical protein
MVSLWTSFIVWSSDSQLFLCIRSMLEGLRKRKTVDHLLSDLRNNVQFLCPDIFRAEISTNFPIPRSFLNM